METNRLRQFCTIVDTGNLRKAASFLGISHGGLSKSMKQLEHEIGFVLFSPSGRGLAVTDRGLLFYDQACILMKQIENILKPSQSKLNQLRIGSFEVFTTYFLPTVFESEFLDYDVLLSELIPGQLETALRNRNIDLGITYEPIPQPGLDYLRVCPIEMAVFGSRRFRNQTNLTELPFVAPVLPLESTPSGVKGLDGFPDHKINRNIKYRVDMLQSALQIASKELAVGFFPKFLITLYNKTVSDPLYLFELRSLKTGLQIRRSVYIVKRESTQENAMVKKIAKHLRTLCGDL